MEYLDRNRFALKEVLHEVIDEHDRYKFRKRFKRIVAGTVLIAGIAASRNIIIRAWNEQQQFNQDNDLSEGEG